MIKLAEKGRLKAAIKISKDLLKNMDIIWKVM